MPLLKIVKENLSKIPIIHRFTVVSVSIMILTSVIKRLILAISCSTLSISAQATTLTVVTTAHAIVVVLCMASVIIQNILILLVTVMPEDFGGHIENMLKNYTTPSGEVDTSEFTFMQKVLFNAYYCYDEFLYRKFGYRFKSSMYLDRGQTSEAFTGMLITVLIHLAAILLAGAIL